MNIVVNFCDRCSSSIPERDHQTQEALVTNTIKLCTTCRRALGGGRGDAEILFCESCGRSISAPDLNSGSVRAVGGRFLCASCLPASVAAVESRPQPTLAAAPVPQRARTRSGSGLLTLFMVAFIGGLVSAVALSWAELGTFLSGEEVVASEPTEPEEGPDPLRLALDDVRVELQALDGRIYELATRAAVPKELTTHLAALDDMLAQSAAGSKESLALVNNSVLALVNQVDDLVGEMEVLRELVQSATLATPEDSDGMGDDDPVSPEPPAGDAEVGNAGESGARSEGTSVPPEIAKWVEDLSSADSGRRFSAIVELARMRNPTAVPGLGEVAVLDTDTYVRNEACRALGGFGDVRAAEYLVKALRDSEPMVALTAAESLRQITRKSFGFTNKANAQQRRDATERWEEWWERSRPSVEGKETEDR